MSDLLCPCGSESFKATLTTRTEYTYNVRGDHDLIEVAEEVVDGGDLGDIETVTCDECGSECYPEHGDPDASCLVTQAEYDAMQEPDECDCDPGCDCGY